MRWIKFLVEAHHSIFGLLIESMLARGEILPTQGTAAGVQATST